MMWMTGARSQCRRRSAVSGLPSPPFNVRPWQEPQSCRTRLARPAGSGGGPPARSGVGPPPPPCPSAPNAATRPMIKRTGPRRPKIPCRSPWLTFRHREPAGHSLPFPVRTAQIRVLARRQVDRHVDDLLREGALRFRPASLLEPNTMGSAPIDIDPAQGGALLHRQGGRAEIVPVHQDDDERLLARRLAENLPIAVSRLGADLAPLGVGEGCGPNCRAGASDETGNECAQYAVRHSLHGSSHLSAIRRRL